MKIRTVNYDIAMLVAANGGYCPCAIEKTPDTKCICKEFKEQETEDPCLCGRYMKVVDE